MTNVIAPDDARTAPPDAGFLLDIYLRHLRDLRDASRTKRLATEGLSGDKWYASGLGKCLRLQYLERKGTPRLREIDADARRTFAWGDHVEDFVRQVYRRCGLVQDTQWRLEHGSLVARGDFLLRYPAEDVSEIPEDVRSEWSPDWIAMLEALRAQVRQSSFVGLVASEIKSAKSSSMRYMYNPKARGGPKGEGAREEHLVQVGASMVLTELIPDAPRPDFWQIEYVGKDAVGVLRFPVAKKWANVALERWKTLDEIWTSQPDPRDVECTCGKKLDGSKGLPIEYCAYYDGGTGTCCGNAGLGQSQLVTADGDPF